MLVLDSTTPELQEGKSIILSDLCGILSIGLSLYQLSIFSEIVVLKLFLFSTFSKELRSFFNVLFVFKGFEKSTFMLLLFGSDKIKLHDFDLFRILRGFMQLVQVKDVLIFNLLLTTLGVPSLDSNCLFCENFYNCFFKLFCVSNYTASSDFLSNECLLSSVFLILIHVTFSMCSNFLFSVRSSWNGCFIGLKFAVQLIFINFLSFFSCRSKNLHQQQFHFVALNLFERCLTFVHALCCMI